MRARTPYLKLLSASTMALLVIMVAGYLTSERASAQRIPPPPSDPVLDAVQQVQRSIAGLQVNLDALQSGLDLQLAPLGVNFRWTPPAFASEGSAFCYVVNIIDVQKRIRIELKDGQGENLIDETVETAPGTTISVGLGQPRTGEFNCKFTVLNGTRADIRGAIATSSRNGHLSRFPAE